MPTLERTLMPLLVMLVACLACNMIPGRGAGGAYTSDKDKFSVNFPAGGEVADESTDAKFAKTGRKYSKDFDNRSDNYRSYEVAAYEIDDYRTRDKELKEILEIGLNGWEDEPETTVKEVSINGQRALDSVRTIEIGPARMTFREVVLWSSKDKKLYVVQVAATKRENVSTKEADDFVNSFKLTA